MPSHPEELRLLTLMKRFNKNLFLDYLSKVKNVINDIEDLPNVRVVCDNGFPIAFRITLQEPVYLLLSHPICRLKHKVIYPIEIGWERFFVTQLGTLPVYFVSFNIFSLLKLWGEEASMTSSKVLDEMLKKGCVYFEIQPDSRAAQFSSMNFLLQMASKLYYAPSVIEDSLSKMFKYGFWSMPTRGFGSSAHFFHTRVKISHFLKIAKGLYSVERLGGKLKINLIGQIIPCREIFLKGFTVQDGEITLLRLKTLVPIDVAEDLENKDLRQCFLNAIITEVRSNKDRFKLLSIITDLGESYFELITTIISLILFNRYYRNPHPSFVCTLHELRHEVNSVLSQISRHFVFPSRLSDAIARELEYIFLELYPVYLIDNDVIYHFNPTLYGFLSLLKREECVKGIEHSPSLWALMRLLEKIQENESPMNLYLSEEMDQFRGIGRQYVLNKLYEAWRRIFIQKIIRNKLL